MRSARMPKEPFLGAEILAAPELSEFRIKTYARIPVIPRGMWFNIRLARPSRLLICAS